MKFLRDLLERARMLIFRNREERELAEELRFHVEMEARQNERAGMSPGEAHRHGVHALGGVERVKEDVRDARGTRLLEDSVADFRYALRSLRQAPGFTIVAVLTLALGIGSTTAVFSAVDTVLLQPLPYERSGQLVRLYYYDKDPAKYGFVSPVHYLDYRSKLTLVDAVAGEYTYRQTGGDVGSGDAAHRIQLMPVTADYFDVMRVYPAVGHTFTRDDETDAPTIVISDRLWHGELGGDPGVAGRSLIVSGRRVTVAGVMPPGFTDPIVGAVDAWTPMDMQAGKDVSNVDDHFVTVVARLKPGVSVARAQAEVDVLNSALDKQYPGAPDARAILFPLKDDLVGPSSLALELLLGAVGLVLLLVCVNVANLLLVRGSARAREFALRAALGAERARLVRQLLIESLTLAAAGAIGGVILAQVGMSAIVALGGTSIPRLADMTLNGRLMGFSLAIASVCAVAFGLAPALRAGRAQPTDMLRDHSRSATSGRGAVKLRDWLVVSQVALAFVLLVGAGLLIASFEHLRQVDLGVNAADVLTFELNLPPARYDSTARARFHETVAERMRGLPGAVAAGGVSILPATGPAYMWGTRALTGPLVGAKENKALGQQRVITGSYFAAVGIPLLEGRVFDARDDAAAPKRAIVSQSLARKLFPKMSAVGQRISAGDRNAEIIGVVGDVAIDAEGRGGLYVYHANTQYGNRAWTIMQVIRTNGSLGTLQSAARRALADLDPQLVAYKPMPLADAIGQGESQRVFMLRVLATFAAIALALAALGLFGVLSYGVGLRTREFGIRMALGADRASIRRDVLRQGLMVTAIGTSVGLVGALALSRVMATLVFHMSPLDPWVLLGAVAFMGITGAVAAFVPAHRATTVDPRTALQ